MEAPPDPADLTPEDRQKVRGGRTPVVGPWIVLTLILILGAAAYALSTL